MAAGAEGAVTREARAASLAAFAGYHWIMLRAFHGAAVRRLGAAGEEAVWRGVRRYGLYRGQWLRERPEGLAAPRDAAALACGWDTGELLLAQLAGGLVVTGTRARLELELAEAPGAAYFREHDGGEALDPFWRTFLDGVATAWAPGATAVATSSHAAPWRLTLAVPGASEEPFAGPLPDPLDDPAAAIALTRRCVGVLAALQLNVSRELVAAFDATGEDVVREAAYQFGAERGSAVRERHLAEGRPLTLRSFMSGDGLQERDPGEDVFVMAGEQHLSDGAWYADCTSCPLQEVWGFEGHEGLRLGFLFDAPNHRGLFESYHPGTIVRWDAVKSRGDAVCKFRFTVPELLTDADPTPEEYDRAQAERLGYAL